MKRRDYWVEVCSACRRASCWHGEFYCEKAKTAGTILVKASALRRERNERPSFFTKSKVREVCGVVHEVFP